MISRLKSKIRSRTLVGSHVEALSVPGLKNQIEVSRRTTTRLPLLREHFLPRPRQHQRLSSRQRINPRTCKFLGQSPMCVATRVPCFSHTHAFIFTPLSTVVSNSYEVNRVAIKLVINFVSVLVYRRKHRLHFVIGANPNTSPLLLISAWLCTGAH